MTTTPNAPETVQELLDRQAHQEEEVNYLELALRSLHQCLAEDNHKVAYLILENLRDWHLCQLEEADNPLSLTIDATRCDSALKLLSLVTFD